MSELVIGRKLDIMINLKGMGSPALILQACLTSVCLRRLLQQFYKVRMLECMSWIRHLSSVLSDMAWGGQSECAGGLQVLSGCSRPPSLVASKLR